MGSKCGSAMTFSGNEPGRKLSIKSTALVLIALGFVIPRVSCASAAQADSSTATHDQSTGQKSTGGSGVIAGVVVNERQEPVPRAQVQAFSVRAAVPEAQQGKTVPFSKRANGSSADAEGRFRISGLDVGDYLVAAEAVPSFTSGASGRTPVYATTFYPSTIDYQAAVRVSALSYEGSAIRIEMVEVKGARVAGSAVSQSGRTSGGMDVRFFHRFGGFGSEAAVTVTDPEGKFEIEGVPPAWYRLTVASRQAASNSESGEFATRLIKVQEKDISGLVLPLGTGASISGRVVSEPGAGIHSAVGMRVSASPTSEQYGPPKAVAATVASDWSFRMRGLSGSYRFTAVPTGRRS